MTEPAQSTGERWIDRDGGHYCTAHSYAFPRGEVCHACCADPGPAIKVTPDGLEDVALAASEQRVLTFLLRMKRCAEEKLDGTDLEFRDGLKAGELYLKAERLWDEKHTKRMQIESDERLIEHDRRMAGLRGSN